MKPAAGKGFIGGLFVLEIAFHHDIAAEHHLTDGLAVARHRLHGLGIEHGDGFLQRVGHALTPLEFPIDKLGINRTAVRHALHECNQSGPVRFTGSAVSECCHGRIVTEKWGPFICCHGRLD